MMEVVATPTGSPVVRWGGLSLTSLKYPEKDASKWLTQIESQIKDYSHVIVLGLGCGYHIFELIKNFPNKNIFVVETCSELVDFCEQNFSLEMSQFSLIQTSNINEFVGSARLQKALSKPYAVVEHRPSMQTQPSLYSEMQAVLLGRERGIFREHLKLRAQRSGLLDDKKMLQGLMDESKDHNELLSIKDIENWLLESQRWSKAGSLVQVLRELLK